MLTEKEIIESQLKTVDDQYKKELLNTMKKFNQGKLTIEEMRESKERLREMQETKQYFKTLDLEKEGL